MAAATLPKPGTIYGPCKDACKHVDCEQTRSMADTVCAYGDGPIGYDEHFYQTERGLAHAACEEDAHA
jgi:hypothetical protein